MIRDFFSKRFHEEKNYRRLVVRSYARRKFSTGKTEDGGSGSDDSKEIRRVACDDDPRPPNFYCRAAVAARTFPKGPSLGGGATTPSTRRRSRPWKTSSRAAPNATPNRRLSRGFEGVLGRLYYFLCHNEYSNNRIDFVSTTVFLRRIHILKSAPEKVIITR